MRRVLVLVAATAGVLLGTAGSASAGTLDQQQTVRDQIGFFGSFTGQTFTAGLSGTLDEVDLTLTCDLGGGPSTSVTVEIRTVSAGLPTDTVLATEDIDVEAGELSNPPSFEDIVRFSSPPTVLAGTQYAILIDTGGGDCESGESTTDTYAGGTKIAGSAATPTSIPTKDLMFRTFVVVPNPPTSASQPGASLLPGTSAQDPKCKRLHRKLRHQKENLTVTVDPQKKAEIEAHIKDSKRRLKRLACG